MSSHGSFVSGRSLPLRGRRMLFGVAVLAIVGSLYESAVNAQQKPRESDYYTIETVPIPESMYLEVGAIEFLPDGRMAVSSRRGEIAMFHDPLQADASKITATLFAQGLHEVLGLAWRDGSLYATQRGEVSRLTDENGDGRADLIECISDGWSIGGDYHEYAFGSKFDRNGDLWIVLCLTGSFSSELPYRGWCVRVSADGKMTPTCSGIRSPGGIGFNAAGDAFYTDNQGPWNGTSGLKFLRPGSFQGHPAGNRWYELTDALGERPAEPESGSRIVVEADRIPQYEPPAILFPYYKMGQSASGIACDLSQGSFGPFGEQLFVGDQTLSTVMRVALEQVDGHYQGACFPFLEGFGSGNVAVQFAPDGSLFVGGTSRGWGSRGGKEFALERVRWTGKVPFEVLSMSARPDGFELTFTQPVDRRTAEDPASYSMPTYTYLFQSAYGSPEVDQVECRIERVEVSEDGLKARLFVDRLHRGHVHELHLDGVRNVQGEPLLHPVGYYTLQYLPK